MESKARSTARKCSFQKSDKATEQHFFLDHGELVYVFSILDKQTTSNCLVVKLKHAKKKFRPERDSNP